MPDGPVHQVPVGGPPSPHDGVGIYPMVDFGAYGYKEHPCTSFGSGGFFEKYRTFGRDVIILCILRNPDTLINYYLLKGTMCVSIPISQKHTKPATQPPFYIGALWYNTVVNYANLTPLLLTIL